MRLIAPLAALAALTFAHTAAAATVSIAPVAFAPEFESEREDVLTDRETDYVQRTVATAVSEALARAGAQIGPNGDTTVEVTIVDIDPNRPTFQQLRGQPGLDMIRSVSIGGAELHGVVRGADGAVIAVVDHDYYSPSIEDVRAAGTWTDAQRSIRMFAEKVADAYVASGR